MQQKFPSLEKKIDVSIVTVNYNGFIDTCELIDSVLEYLPAVVYELIVVDNASENGEGDLLAKRYPWIIVVKNEKNLGFAGGNNAGISVSKGKYIFLLNNDTLIRDNTISFLIGRLNTDPQIGAVSPKIKFAFAPENIQYAGYTKLSPVTLRNKTIGLGEQDSGQYDLPAPVPYLHGAAMMIKREVIEKTGGMPEIYFLYYEELDWCTKMTRSGFTLYYEPGCTVYHKESQSTGQASPLRTFFLTRNRLLYAFRNLKGITRPVSLCYQLSAALAKNSITFLVNGRKDLAKAALSGAWHFILLKNKAD